MAVVNDIVLIYLEDTPVSFAKVESILPDTKKEWFHIKLLMLQIPLQVVTWILKQEYINGETFSMNDKKMRIEKVETPAEDISLSHPANPDKKNAKKKSVSSKKQDAKIISFPDKKTEHE